MSWVVLWEIVLGASLIAMGVIALYIIWTLILSRRRR